MGLETYRRKRDFDRTREPRGATRQRSGSGPPSFVIQKHAARRLHYDFRLEVDGVLVSWAVPKGPPLEPGAKALAVQTEDHPLEYGAFEGVIPKGEYGGGTVMLWDRGTWEPEGDPRRGLAEGKLSFRLSGERLRGRWTLVRTGGDDSAGNWLLIKRSDAERSRIGRGEERSVASGRTMEEIAAEADRTWSSRDGEAEPAETRVDASSVPGARRAAFPKAMRPQLATLVADVPEGEGFVHEIKWDGYRLLAEKRGESVRLLTRSGQDWTDRFGRVAAALARLPVEDAIVDGEVVVLDAQGRPDFQALQNSFDGRGDARHVFYAFDLPYCAGHDLTAARLLDRKALLERLCATLPGEPALRYSDHVQGGGEAFFARACELGVEGIVSKRADAPYRQKRSDAWVKVKCLLRQEFVIGGYTDPSGSRAHFGALLLGYHDADGALRFCGKVGTGFSEASLAALAARLTELETDTCPFAGGVERRHARQAHWVRPELVAEVAFSGWTSDGRLRHPVFHGLREDKSAREVRREETAAAPNPGPSAAAPEPPIRLTNPDRVLYPEMGITKRELVDYYVAIRDHVLPHVVDRPLTLLRCPRGRGGTCFYQKHAHGTFPDAVRGVEIEEKEGSGTYVFVADLEGLLSLVQVGVLEIHPWGSRVDRPDRPDRIVFDLDPGEDVGFGAVVETALALREILTAVGLEAFARTTGGKGLHVVVPITRRSTWPEVKEFARSVADRLRRTAPERFVLTASKAQRKGRIFLDYLRNDRGATAIASYATRARPGAPVATPVAWDEVTESLDPKALHVRSVPDRLRRIADPWEGFFGVRQSLGAAVRARLADLG